MPAFGGDHGWAGSYVPMVVSATCLAELRDLAGPPANPGDKKVEVNLFTGEFAWKARAVRRTYSRRRRRK